MKRAFGALGLLAILLGPLAGPASAEPGTTERTSVSSSGAQGNDISGRLSQPSLSDDGLVSVYDSQARNLVPADTNNAVDVFAHERVSNVTERVSVSSAEVQANDSSEEGAPDGDGSLVAFESSATNLVTGDTNDADDVFLRDRPAGTTVRISVSSAGAQADGSSGAPDLTPDGRLAAFFSDATNLVAGDTNATRDVFVRDVLTGTNELISVSSAEVPGNLFSAPPAISDDGRFVAFGSFANNLVAGDANGNLDVFVRDRTAGTTELVSVSSAEVQGDSLSSGAAISADGRYVAFFSEATNLVAGDTNATRDIFVRDRIAGTTERVNVSSDEAEADAQSSFSIRGDSTVPAISDDGSVVSFDSFATNLVPDDTNGQPDAFVRDRVAGVTERVSVSSAGEQGNDGSSDTDVSGDGLVVTFISKASNLVPGDTNVCPLFNTPGHCPDVFVHDRGDDGPPPTGGADVAVAMTDSPDPVRFRSTLTYSIVVSNGGPDAATGVTLTDALPTQVRFVSVTTTAGTCTTGPRRTVTCSLGTVASGATVTVTITTTASQPGTATNTASVTSTSTDPVTTNNSDTETTRIIAR